MGVKVWVLGGGGEILHAERIVKTTQRNCCRRGEWPTRAGQTQGR